MSTVDQMIKSFTDAAEYKAFIESQQKVINDLTKKNKKLEDEVAHLQKLLESTNPLIIGDKKPSGEGIAQSILICELEIAKLQDIAVGNPLTFEEVKKLDVLVKNLIILKEEEQKSKKQELDSKSKEELLRLVETT